MGGSAQKGCLFFPFSVGKDEENLLFLYFKGSPKYILNLAKYLNRVTKFWQKSLYKTYQSLKPLDCQKLTMIICFWLILEVQNTCKYLCCYIHGRGNLTIKISILKEEVLLRILSGLCNPEA